LVAIGAALALIITVIAIISMNGGAPPTTPPSPSESSQQAPEDVTVQLTLDQFVAFHAGDESETEESMWWEMSPRERDFYSAYSEIAPRLTAHAADYRGDGVPASNWPGTINYVTVSRAITAGARTYSIDYGEVELRFFNSQENAELFSQGWSDVGYHPGVLRVSHDQDGTTAYWLEDEATGKITDVRFQYANVTATFLSWEPTEDEIYEQMEQFVRGLELAME
jgi:hypothetical protein